ncbi:MAG: Na+/H+ antiporter NhaC family protein [Oscillospiraceae bacterium]|nr:Na+/H+ antiporter NhaC family protein [Oscillospiraceae bacterium]
MFGGLVGCLICCNFNIIKSIEMLFNILTTKMSENIYIIIFLALLGSIVMIITSSGGAVAYGNLISKKIKNKTGAQLATILLGIVIFIDDYFNCLTIGATMGPVFDKYKISREKLAYLIDSTAAPICIIAPISSWVAVILSTLEGSGVKNSFGIFIRTIPYNFYAILTIIMVFCVAIFKLDFGPMAKFEKEDKINNLDLDNNLNNNNSKKNKKANSSDLLIPIVSLIIFSILSLLHNGGYFSGGVTILEAFRVTDSQKSLTFGATVALAISFVLMIITKRMNFKDYMENISDGVKSMVPAYLILILAWTIGGVCQKIGTGEYVKHIVEVSNIPVGILPVVIFIVSGFLAFSTGTAWGTFGILIPVVVGVARGLSEDLLVIFVASTLAGAAFGSHSSPISDTCVLSATGASCKHINHVLTQIPYSCLVAIICCLDYIIINFINSLIISYIFGISLMLVSIYYLSKFSNKSNHKFYFTK